jgi:Flp pilus assembly protein TadG
MSIKRFANHRGGAAAVEFALVMLFFITLILGIEEVARFIAIKQDLMSAVQLTSRYAIVHGSSSSSPATATTLQQMVGHNLVMINAAAITPSVTFSGSPGSTVSIGASYTWTPLAASLHLPSATISVTSTATILH